MTGASGYIGGRLVPRLLARGHSLRLLTRQPKALTARFPQCEIVAGDVSDGVVLGRALDGIDAAYYLIHSMRTNRRDFADRDRATAQAFARAAQAAGVGRIIYLGGLGDERADLSEHLRSRQEVGQILASTGVPVTEFRAAVIVGSGSVSFEMIRYLTERLPAMVAPRWVKTRCQPIAIRDVLSYLTNTLDLPNTAGRIYEIGGADVLSYREMMFTYARIRGLRRFMLVVPVLTPRLSSYWVHLVTPIPAYIARNLIDSLHNEVVVHDESARRDFAIEPMGYADAVQRALNRYTPAGPETTWFDAPDIAALPGEFAGLTQGMLIDRRERRSGATPMALFAVFSGLGGTRGWLYADWLWELRGAIDGLMGGIGRRRGRRSQTELRVGDALDFWRVEAYEPNHLLRLRAEMKVPGHAWLQFEALPARDGTGSALRQTAFFEPRGIFGYLYWYAVAPLHTLIFGKMATRIAQLAERT